VADRRIRHQAFDVALSDRRERAEHPSMNTEAFRPSARRDAGNLWITAEIQTEGRGRRGRTWVTTAAIFAASLLLIDPASPEISATISFVAGVALHQAVIDAAGRLSPTD